VTGLRPRIFGAGDGNRTHVQSLGEAPKAAEVKTQTQVPNRTWGTLHALRVKRSDKSAGPRMAHRCPVLNANQDALAGTGAVPVHDLGPTFYVYLRLPWKPTRLEGSLVLSLWGLEVFQYDAKRVGF